MPARHPRRRTAAERALLQFAGYAKFLVGSDEEAVALLRCSIEINRNNLLVHFQLAAALARISVN
jgi:hypothetical protein